MNKKFDLPKNKTELDVIIKAMLEYQLENSKGDIVSASKKIGISQYKIRKMIDDSGIDVNDYLDSSEITHLGVKRGDPRNEETSGKARKEKYKQEYKEAMSNNKKVRHYRTYMTCYESYKIQGMSS